MAGILETTTTDLRNMPSDREHVPLRVVSVVEEVEDPEQSDELKDSNNMLLPLFRFQLEPVAPPVLALQSCSITKLTLVLALQSEL
jgi:hypothetical protein